MTHAISVRRDDPSCRGFARQRLRREREQHARRRAADFAERLRNDGASYRQAASCLDLSPHTLRSWKTLQQDACRTPAPRGRPCSNSPPEKRREVAELLRELGPHAGVPQLRRAFPDVARSELAELQAAERRRRCERRAVYARRLQWRHPGTVWAMDYAEPPTPIDGVYPALFSVRDLASGRQLAWLPVPAATAEHAAAALEALFLEHGPPLVLKCDNGSPFIAEQTQDLLADRGVTTLFSPPYTPRYNGACEAGIGGLKVRTHHLAAAHGRPGRWTTEDVEAARRLADEEQYPRRLHGRTAEEVWQERSPPTEEERRRLRDVVDCRRQEIRNRRGIPLLEVLDRARQASLDRRAVSRALVALGYLSFLRSDITPPINLT
jgi:transposase InsO family protein